MLSSRVFRVVFLGLIAAAGASPGTVRAADDSWEGAKKKVSDAIEVACAAAASQANQIIKDLYFDRAKAEMNKLLAKVTAQDLADFKEYIRLFERSEKEKAALQKNKAQQGTALAEKADGWLIELQALAEKEAASKALIADLGTQMGTKRGLLNAIGLVNPVLQINPGASLVDTIFVKTLPDWDRQSGDLKTIWIRMEYGIPRQFTQAFDPNIEGGMISLDPLHPQEVQAALVDRDTGSMPIIGGTSRALPAMCGGSEQKSRIKGEQSLPSEIPAVTDAARLGKSADENSGVASINSTALTAKRADEK